MRKDHNSTAGGLTRRNFLKTNLGALAAPAFLRAASSPAQTTGQRFYLVKSDKPLPRIVRGREDGHAAQVMAAALKRLTGKEAMVMEEMPGSGNSAPTILAGSAGSNPAVADLLGREPLAQKLQPDGFLVKTLPGSPERLLLAGADRVGALYAVHELINFYLEAQDSTAWVPPLSVLENPALKYRIFWTWDHSTNWELGVKGLQEDGCENPYMKSAETFLKDYKKVVDYMSAHKLNGLIIWGFLRDSHGGVKAAQELVDYAHERGVHVLPGIGTSYYGGIYYEGKNKFNVNTWLAENPNDLRLLDNDGKLLSNAICPSKPANQQWLREGAEWLFKTFPNLGGVNLENGDFRACQTEDCQRARERAENDPNFYWDMMATQLPIIEAGSKINAQSWFTYATYTGFSEGELWQNTPKPRVRTRVPRFVEQYPEFAICQWTYSGMVGTGERGVNPSLWPKGVKPPTCHSIGLLHQGSQWWGGARWWSATAWGNDVGARYEEMVETIRYTAQRVFEEGLEGVEILGEVSPTSPQNELNYLAFEEFCWHPHRSVQEFIDQRLNRFYGNRELGRRFVETVLADERTPRELRRRQAEALDLAEDRSLTPEQRERWGDLARELARRLAIPTRA